MNERELLDALRLKYPEKEYALMPHVANATGMSANRHIDALMMSLWPSRGMEIDAFEIKCSRSDFLRELKQPEKAESIARYCDRFWLVTADDSIVKEGELPRAWGLLVYQESRKQLHIQVSAPKLEAQPIDRKFLAAILRAVQKETTWNHKIDAKMKAEHAKGEEWGKYERGKMKDEFDRVVKSVSDFEDASGVRIDRWTAGNIGKAVALALRYGPDAIVARFSQLSRNLKQITDSLEADLARTEKHFTSQEW
jgi:hypothetical protein